MIRVSWAKLAMALRYLAREPLGRRHNAAAMTLRRSAPAVLVLAAAVASWLSTGVGVGVIVLFLA